MHSCRKLKCVCVCVWGRDTPPSVITYGALLHLLYKMRSANPYLCRGHVAIRILVPIHIHMHIYILAVSTIHIKLRMCLHRRAFSHFTNDWALAIKY